MIKNFAEHLNTAFDIVVIAGQSNAEGCGYGVADVPYEKDERVYVMRDTESARIVFDSENMPRLQANCPAVCNISVAEDNLPTANMGFSFAREYVKNDLLKGRKLLVIFAGVNGTGFTRPEWGEGNIMNSRLFAAIDEALQLNPNNRLVAFLWHQGEHDVFERSNNPVEEIEAFYYEKLKNLFCLLRARYGLPLLPIVTGGFVDEWRVMYEKQCDAVMNATKKVCDEIGNAGFVEAYGLNSNNQEIGNGDNIHFSRKSQYILGVKYYAVYKENADKKAVLL